MGATSGPLGRIGAPVPGGGLLRALPREGRGRARRTRAPRPSARRGNRGREEALNRAVGRQAVDLGGGIAELAKNGPGVLANRRDRVHTGLQAMEVEGRLQPTDSAGGGAAARQAPPRRELRVAPEL